MYSKILILVAALLCLSSLCLAYEWSDCGSEDGSDSESEDGSDSGSLINVVGKDCGNGKICTLFGGQNASFEITFKSKIATKSVKARLFVDFGNKVKFNLRNRNPLACEEAGLTCPLVPESTYTYKKSFIVNSRSPRNIPINFFGELLAEDGSRLFCVKMPVSIMK